MQHDHSFLTEAGTGLFRLPTHKGSLNLGTRDGHAIATSLRLGINN